MTGAGRHRIRGAALLFLFCLLPGCTEVEWEQVSRQVLTEIGNAQPVSRPLSLGEIDAGLREALRVGSERVVGRVGRADGFSADPAIRVPLPDKVAAARAKVGKYGLDPLFADLELRLNRAAEAAAPRAQAIFWQAITEMTIADVRGVFTGPEDAATRYFERTTSAALAAAMRPVIEQTLSEVGALRVYNEAAAQLHNLPFAPEIRTDLTGYVVARGTAGIFHYLAQEEAAIRKDPARRTTDLLRRVFGGRRMEEGRTTERK